MLRIDSHQHFWEYNQERDAWITEDMQIIRRNFSPEDLWPVLQSNEFDGCIAVQANQSEEETFYLAQLADQFSFIKGVVGWVDLQSDNISERLSVFSTIPVIKGFRHVLQGEPQRDIMLNPAFKNGIKALGEFNFTYDLLIFPDQIKFCSELVKEFPNQKFVIDHIAKPDIKLGTSTNWKQEITEIAQHPNVYCKISGMVTEANWNQWSRNDFKPYLDTIVEAFGTNRVLFGSDWPVCKIAASYEEVVDIVADYFSMHSNNEKEKIFGLNALEFYTIK